MSILSILSALLPIIGKLLDVLTKTPEERIIDIKDALLIYLEEINAGVKKAKDTKGDTSDLEKALNKHR